MRSSALAVLVALSLTSIANATPSDAGRLVFDVTRNDLPFGRHSITVSGSGDHMRAQSRVSFSASMGPVRVYQLEQSCTETWTDGALSELSCSTLKDGRRTRVQGEVEDGRLRVVGADGENWFPLGVFPATWWSMPPSSATTFINTETGEPMEVTVSRMGRETITVGGQSIQAQRIRVRGALTADLWYDSEGRWVGCEFRARGQHIEYRLASPLNAAPA